MEESDEAVGPGKEVMESVVSAAEIFAFLHS